MIQFEVGKTYITRSSCDYDTIFAYTVIKRTDKTITVQEDHGNTKRVKVHKHYSEECECAYPDGHYSMCPVIRADRFEQEELVTWVDADGSIITTPVKSNVYYMNDYR